MIKTAWQYAGSDKLKYVLVYTSFLISNLFQAGYPIIWGMLVNEFQQKGSDAFKAVWWYAAAYMLIKILDWTFHGPARVVERTLAFNMGKNILDELYHKTLHLPIKWHQDNHSGATINKIRKAHEALKDFFQQGFEYLHTIFKFVFSLIAILYFSPVFGLLSMCMCAIVIILVLQFDKVYIKTLESVNQKEHKVSSTIFDSLSNVVTVITLRLEKRMKNGLLARYMEILKPFRKNAEVNEWKWFVTDLLVGITYVLVIVGFVYKNYSPGILLPLGGLVTLTAYLERFTSVFYNLAYLYTDVVKYATDVRTASDIVDSFEKYKTKSILPVDMENWQTLDISNLSFSYTETHNSLQNIHLSLQKGQKVAVIGESGCGKSTLLAVLRGLYIPDSGTILLDHAQIQIETFSKQVTLFPQEPEIFENTIAFNLTLGLPYEEEYLMEIAETVNFKDVIEGLPNGLESSIVEKGVNLSGGQKQRLALARGVFAAEGSNIILMDEPTSNVDPKTEMEIYDRLFEKFKNTLIISSLHRLHLLKKFDYIYVMDKGKIVENGTFEDLLKMGKKFKELWSYQDID
ncbi:MAG: ABC transporter ATP-binding protein [Leadbetterella sp.]